MRKREGVCVCVCVCVCLFVCRDLAAFRIEVHRGQQKGKET